MASKRSLRHKHVASVEFANRLRVAARGARGTMTVTRSGEKADGYVLLTCDEALAVADLVMDLVRADG